MPKLRFPGPMSCTKVRQLFDDFLKKKLNIELQSRIEGHLLACKECSVAFVEEMDGAFERGDLPRSTIPPLPIPKQLAELWPQRRVSRDSATAYRQRFGIRTTALKPPAQGGQVWAKNAYAQAQHYLLSARSLWRYQAIGLKKAVIGNMDAGMGAGAPHMGHMGRHMGSQVPTRVTLLDEFWQPVGESDAFTIKQHPALTKEGKFVLTVRTQDGQYEGWKLLCTVQAIEGRQITFEDIVAKAQTWPDDAPAVEPLTAVLRDTEGEVRRRVNEVLRAVEEALERIGDARALETLVTALLKDKDSTVRRMAAQALGQISNPQAVPPLITALRDIDEEVRESAARALGEIGDSSAVPTLLEALQKDEDLTVRQMAVRALGRIGDPSAIPTLLEALRDRNEDMRRIAQQSIDCINCGLCRQGQIWEVRIEEPILDPSEEDVIIPQYVVQLYLAPPIAKADVPGTETSS